ncbi:MAG: hypothetical protein U0350_02510 [Caldilineaceae bacterium]
MPVKTKKPATKPADRRKELTNRPATKPIKPQPVDVAGLKADLEAANSRIEWLVAELNENRGAVIRLMAERDVAQAQTEKLTAERAQTREWIEQTLAVFREYQGEWAFIQPGAYPNPLD